MTLAARRSSLAALEELEAQRAGYGQGVQAVFQAAGEARLGASWARWPICSTCPGSSSAPSRRRWASASSGWSWRRSRPRRRRSATSAGPGAARPRSFRSTGSTGAPRPTSAGTPESSGWRTPSSRRAIPGWSRTCSGRSSWSGTSARRSACTRRTATARASSRWGASCSAPPGALGGGRAASSGDASLLARKRAIRDLGEELGRLERELEETQERVRQAEARVLSLDESQRAHATARESAEADRLTASKDLEQIVREAERVGLHWEACRAELAQLRGEAEAVEAEARTHRAALGEVEAAGRAWRRRSPRSSGGSRPTPTRRPGAPRRSWTRRSIWRPWRGAWTRSSPTSRGTRSTTGRRRSASGSGEERLVALRARLDEGRGERERLDARAEVGARRAGPGREPRPGSRPRPCASGRTR